MKADMRQDIPMGYTKDSFGNVLTYKDAKGWQEYTYDGVGNLLTYKDCLGSLMEYTRDDAQRLTICKNNGGWYEHIDDKLGNILTYKDSDGNSFVATYDALGNLLTEKNSDGLLLEYTRDDLGNELTFKTRDGDWMVLAIHPKCNLWFNPRSNIYQGEGRWFTSKEALENWSSRNDAIAVLFTAAIRKHLG